MLKMPHVWDRDIEPMNNLRLSTAPTYLPLDINTVMFSKRNYV
jgi:hypothetical protein